MALAYANPAAGDCGARQVRFCKDQSAFNSQTAESKQEPLLAELTGSDTCTGGGITVQSSTPVLGLCKALLAAGLDPDSALQVYRAGTLALSIRNISEAAGLEVNAKGTGFVRAPVRTAPPMRKNRRAAADGS